jgi:RHS repeat-associated protein
LLLANRYRGNNATAFGSSKNLRQFNLASARVGFNSKENDNEVKGTGNSQDYGARIYDTRLGRWLSMDPSAHKIPSRSPFESMANNPIMFFDGNGEFPYTFHIRAFAPPGAFKGYGFEDDKRGFSAQTTGVTSRIKQNFTIDPSKQTFTGGSPTSDPSTIGGVNMTAEDKGGLNPVGFAKRGDFATAAATSHFEGSNPFFLGQAPNISVSSAIVVTENVKAGTLDVAIDLSSKQFPATEGVIQDSKGNSVFLAGAAAFGDPSDLIKGKETHAASLKIKIGINDKGEFQDVTAGGKKYTISEFNKLVTSKSAGPKPRADKDKKDK